MNTLENRLQTAMDEARDTPIGDLFARLAMANHRFFALSRQAFCRPDTSNANRVFGVETLNEQIYARAMRRAQMLSPRAMASAIALLTAAEAELAAQGSGIARPLIEAVETQYETLGHLGPITPDKATDWLTQRPAFAS